MIRSQTILTGWIPFLVTNVSVAIAVLLSYLLQRLPHANLSLVFLAVVILVAMQYGMRLAVYAAVLSFFVYNFLFTIPLYTLTVAEEGDLATLIFFLFFAVISGHLTARFRSASRATDIALNRLNTLYEFSREMVSAVTPEEIRKALEKNLSSLAGHSVSVSLQPPEPSGQWLQLKDDRLTAGAIWLKKNRLDPQYSEIARNLCAQAAGALVREQLSSDLRSAQLVSEQERLRSALLSSVSHDLRTPLAGITGSASSLMEYGRSLSPGDRDELLQSIQEEAERLDHYIQNLLDMARLGQGDFQVRKDWIDLRDILDSVRNRLRHKLGEVRIQISISEGAQIIHANSTFLEQAIVNVMDNAAQLAPAGSSIDITAEKTGPGVTISITDAGPGIPDNDRERVFEMFYRIKDPAHNYRGTGLGLTICKGLMEAHGGSISAVPNPAGTGTTVMLFLPSGPEQQAA